MGSFWRFMVAEEAMNQAFVKLEQLGFAVAKNGTEHTHPAFIRLLHESDDQSSLALRFQPDGVACLGTPPKTFYAEVKTTLKPEKKHFSMEKTAWEQYHLLRENGNIIILICAKFVERWKFKWQWNFLEDIRLLAPEVTLAGYAPEKRFPVVDRWIAPRGSGRERELRGMRRMAGSGTPYREIDPSSLHSFGVFKMYVIRRLHL